MSLASYLERLLDSTSVFEAALAEATLFDQQELIVSFLNELDKSGLGHSERERRLNLLLDRLHPSEADLTALARVAAQVSSSLLRNAVVQFLPANLKTLAFSKAGTMSPGPSPNRVPGNIDPIAITIPDGQREPLSDYSDVLVLAVQDDPGTTGLLKSKGFVPYRCTTLAELITLLETGEQTCAVLVEPSFLATIDLETQRKLFSELAIFSTFAFVRIQSDGVKVAEPEVTAIIGEGRCRTIELPASEVSIRDKGLREADLPHIENARSRLTAGISRGLFTPSELSESALHILGSALARYCAQRHFSRRVELTSIRATFLHDGHSGAHVALVRLNDLKVPIVVKIGDKPDIIDEARRFLTFIYPDNHELNPELHFHGSDALIIFDVIANSSDAPIAAPSLRECIERHWYAEMGGEISMETEVLARGFSRAIARLVALNVKQCEASPFECKANPYVGGILRMEAAGFDWGFANSLMAIRDEALKIMSQAALSAICHGDAHTGNILLRGDDGFIIDYALSGPGHPCADLVKLELSIYLTLLHPFVGQDNLVELQRDITYSWSTLAELERKYLPMFGSKSNQLCLRLCLKARDAVDAVLVAHKLTRRHYVAVKLLSAWQSLQIPSLQQSAARSLVMALDHIPE
jgi:hypothetical protein